MESSTSRTPSRGTLEALRPGRRASAASVVGSATRLSSTPLPSKHRLISASGFSILGSVPPPGPGLVPTPRPACRSASQPLPEGDVYIISVRNTTGALSLTYDTEKKLLAVGETSGDILVFKTGKPDAVCCLHLPVSRGKLSARVSSVLLDRPLAPLDGSEGRGKAVAVTCLRPWIATEAANSVLLASYADGNIRLWDVKNSTLTRQIDEDRQTLGLAVSPDFQHFVTLGDDGEVYVYDSETGSLTSKLVHSGFHDAVDGHQSRTFSGVFHPLKMNELVTGGWDNLLHFWDLRINQSVRHAGDAHIGGTEALDISVDGRELLSCSWRNKDQLQLWDFDTAKLIETLHPDRVQSYLYAGRYLSENLLCCGGSNENIFKMVHSGQKVTVGSVSGLSQGIYSVALGPMGARYQPNPALNSGRHLIPHNKDKAPRVAICSDQKVIELEIY